MREDKEAGEEGGPCNVNWTDNHAMLACVG